MKKTTLYLPDDLKRRIEAVARVEGKSEADVIRDAIADAVHVQGAPTPRIPLTKRGLGHRSVAERVDEMLKDFGK